MTMMKRRAIKLIKYGVNFDVVAKLIWQRCGCFRYVVNFITIICQRCSCF